MKEQEYKEEFFECRAGCGACCVAISISSAIPGMPNGKPAGTACIHLDKTGLCKIFGTSDRPQVCSDFQAERAICGDTTEDAFRIISDLEGIDYRTIKRDFEPSKQNPSE